MYICTFKKYICARSKRFFLIQWQIAEIFASECTQSASFVGLFHITYIHTMSLTFYARIEIAHYLLYIYAFQRGKPPPIQSVVASVVVAAAVSAQSQTQIGQVSTCNKPFRRWRRRRRHGFDVVLNNCTQCQCRTTTTI